MSGMKGTHLSDRNDYWEGPFDVNPERTQMVQLFDEQTREKLGVAEHGQN